MRRSASLARRPSLKEQFEILHRLPSITEPKLPPQRGKVKKKIFKSVVHAVLAVGRFVRSSSAASAGTTQWVISIPQTSIMETLVSPVTRSLQPSLSINKCSLKDGTSQRLLEFHRTDSVLKTMKIA